VLEKDLGSLGRTETWGVPELDLENRSSGGSIEDTGKNVSENGDDDELRVHLQHAIDALQQVEQTL